MDEGPNEYIFTAGVPPGSALGPPLWNILYNGVLAVPVLDETTIRGFADNLAFVTARHPQNVEVFATEIVKAVKCDLGRRENGSSPNNGPSKWEHCENECR